MQHGIHSSFSTNGISSSNVYLCEKSIYLYCQLDTGSVSWMAGNHADILHCYIWRWGGVVGEGNGFLYQLITKQAPKEIFQLVTNNFIIQKKHGFEYTWITYSLLVFYWHLLKCAACRCAEHRCTGLPVIYFFGIGLQHLSDNVFQSHDFLHFLWCGLKTLVILWKQYFITCEKWE